MGGLPGLDLWSWSSVDLRGMLFRATPLVGVEGSVISLCARRLLNAEIVQRTVAVFCLTAARTRIHRLPAVRSVSRPPQRV